MAKCCFMSMFELVVSSQDQPNAMRNCLRGRIYQPVEHPSRWEIKLGGLEKAGVGWYQKSIRAIYMKSISLFTGFSKAFEPYRW